MRLDAAIAEAELVTRDLLVEVAGDSSAEVTGVTMDSRTVRAGYLFACVPGTHSDGHLFAPAALADGATALLTERLLDLAAPQVVVRSVREALGPVCDAVYGHPSASLTIAAVTGTNGKTTTCAFLAAIFEANGWRSTTIGTLSHRRTTPEAPELHALLAEWRAGGGRAVAMEVSSHALEQHRADAVSFAAGVFTNLTPEHLDYHQTMDAYFEAKARMFAPGRVGVAVVNTDDAWGRRLADRVGTGGGRVVTFSPSGDVTALRLGPTGSEFTWRGRDLRVRVGGLFNIANAVAAATCAEALGLDIDVIVEGLASVEAVAGRFQLVDAGQPFSVVIDYAHTPDGLAKLLESARQITSGNVIAVFGAGGDRDREKRPLMGRVAADLADLAFVTSDNPRSEDPGGIIDEIVAGAPAPHNLLREPDRASAIAAALATAGEGDIVVIAGKGHEKGQEIAGRVQPFDDVEVARTALERIRSSRGSTS